MSRVAWLIVALVLVTPPLVSGWHLVTSTAFLIEFLSGGRSRPLSAITQPSRVTTYPASVGRPDPVDVYVAPSFARASGLVLVHGIAPLGKDEPQVLAAADLLARAGYAVAVPTVGGLTRLRLRPEDAGAVTGAAVVLQSLGHRPVSILAVSLGAAPALGAASQPPLARSTSAILALGGYASARELLRYTLTGAYALGDDRGRHRVDEGGIAQFTAANGELLAGGGEALVENRAPERVDELVDALPDRTRRLLDALSPERAVPRVSAPLFLVHGRGDPTVPFTESLRLARAAETAGRSARTAIVGTMGHVDPNERITARELLTTWATFYAFCVTSRVAR